MRSLYRSFDTKVAATAGVMLAFGVAPLAAQAASDPTWSAASTLTQAGHTGLAPKVASADGTVVAVWSERDNESDNDIVMMSMLRQPNGAWTTAEALSSTSEDVDANQTAVAADDEGNITVAWAIAGSEAQTRTLSAGDTDWSATRTLVADQTNCLRLTPGPDGTVIASWTTNNDAIRVRTRAADGTNWSDAVDIGQGYNSTNQVALDYNASGDGIAVWNSYAGDNDYLIFAARYSRDTDTWSTPGPVTDPDAPVERLGYISAALSPLGNATADWDGNGIFASSVAAGSTSWSTPEVLTLGGDYGLLSGGVVSDRSGNMVAVYQSYEDSSPYTTARALARTRNVETGEWAAPEPLSSETLSGVPSLAVDRNYNIVVGFVDGADFSQIGVGTNYRPDGATTFSGRTSLLPSLGFDMMHGFPVVAIDESGNPAAAWPNTAGSETSIDATYADASGPELQGVSVPSAGTVGELLTFSVDPFDLWSSVDVTTWTFGDTGGATGTGVSHTYSAPGTYTVTVSSTDGEGHSSSTSRTVAIADVPAPPARPQTPAPAPTTTPRVLAPTPPKVPTPTIEALLRGKKITLAARVTLRRGKSCRGTATATTAFGSRNYRRVLKLKTIAGRCVATGTITLKKSPGLRTKLRVKVSSKVAATRTVTTKR